jgi:hypothetical protein
MDDLLATLQGTGPQQSQPQQNAPFDPNKSYGTPAQLLDNLAMTESSNGKNLVNKTTGAMGPYQFLPSTLAMLRNQGVKFDPFDPQQSRNAADYYIQQLKQQNGGTYEGALKAYGGFKTADPSQYIGKVMQGVPTMPGQSNGGEQPQGYSGPTSDLFSTLQQGAQIAQKTPQQPAPAAPTQSQTTTQQKQKTNNAFGLDPITSAIDSAAVHTLGGLAGGIAGSGAGLWKLATTLDPSQANQAFSDTASRVGGVIDQFLTPAGNQTAQNIGQAVVNVPGRVIGAGVNAAGDVIGEAAQSAGASPEIGRNIADLAKFSANVGMTAMGARAMLRGAPESATQPIAAPQAQPGVAPAQEAPVSAGILPEAAAKPRYVPNGDGTFRQVSPGLSQSSAPVPSAMLPAVSGKASDLFPMPDKAPTVSGPLPAAEQAQRAQVIKALGLDSVRDSVINGDAHQSGIEFENAKADTPIGDVTRATIAGEQNAIRDYAARVVDMTGRDSTLDAEGVGQKILAPLQKMSDWFDAKAGDLYTQARQQAGDVPLTETPALTALLGDLDLRDRMAASPERQSLYNAVQSRYARFSGMGDQAAETAEAPARTISNAENFRQWLNAVGRDNPQSGQFISQVKQALDSDVAAAGGAGLFDQARGMWQQRQQMLADPGQLSKLLGDQDGTGLNRNVPLEKVGPRVVGMDGANFRNLLGSLSKIEKMAPELAPDVQGSLAEIRGQAAKQLADAGGNNVYWNANKFSQTAQSMAPKLKLIFNSNEMSALRTLNEAGRIIRQPGAYPGAAAQHINMFRSGISTALPYAANAAGHAIAGPFGGFAGQFAGNKLSSLVRSGGEAATAAKLAKRYATNAQ